MDWIDLAQDRDQWRDLANMVMNLWVLQNVGKFLCSCTTVGFSRRAQLHEVSYSINCVDISLFFPPLWIYYKVKLCNLCDLC
jgi:hypothetical protein